MKRNCVIWIILIFVLVFQLGRSVYANTVYVPRSCGERLKDLEPEVTKIMYDTDLMHGRDLGKFNREILPVSSIVKNGQNIPFVDIYKDLSWKRPAYHPNWHSSSWRWCYVPSNNAYQQHQVYDYRGGLSWWFDLSNGLALPDGAGGPSPINDMAFTIKYPYVVRLIIFKFHVKTIKYYKDRLVVSGEPLRAGIMVIDFDTKDLPEGNKLIQLATPDGYEIDYLVLL